MNVVESVESSCLMSELWSSSAALYYLYRGYRGQLTVLVVVCRFFNESFELEAVQRRQLDAYFKG
jgi:hypothetical protein